MNAGQQLVRITIIPFAIGLGVSIASYLAAGATLGLYLGGIAMLTLMLPALCAARRSLTESFIRATAALDGIAVGWILGLTSSTPVIQWLAAYAILAAYSLALWGIVMALSGIKFAPVVSAAIATTVGALWLTWPIWLATALRSNGGPWMVRWLIPAHPLMAINHVMIDQGVWLQNRLIYRHVTLGQDIPYELPQSILPCVAFHLLVGAAMVVVARGASGSASTSSAG